MHIEPTPPEPLARRRAAVAARIDRIEFDLSRVSHGILPSAVQALLEDLESELAEIDDACLDDGGGEASILRQHATLQRDLESIAELFAAQSFSLAEQRTAVVLLCDLHRELETHLFFEERCIALAVSHAPEWMRRGDLLQIEHETLRSSTHLLVRTAEEAAEDGAAWRSIRSAFAQLHEAIVAHERAETDLLQCAYLEDFGEGD